MFGAISSTMVEILPPLPDNGQPPRQASAREIDSADAVSALVVGDVVPAAAHLHGELGDKIESLTLADDRLGVPQSSTATSCQPKRMSPRRQQMAIGRSVQ
jgi:hypothetical protein